MVYRWNDFYRPHTPPPYSIPTHTSCCCSIKRPTTGACLLLFEHLIDHDQFSSLGQQLFVLFFSFVRQDPSCRKLFAAWIYNSIYVFEILFHTNYVSTSVKELCFNRCTLVLRSNTQLISIKHPTNYLFWKINAMHYAFDYKREVPSFDVHEFFSLIKSSDYR